MNKNVCTFQKTCINFLRIYYSFVPVIVLEMFFINSSSIAAFRKND